MNAGYQRPFIPFYILLFLVSCSQKPASIKSNKRDSLVLASMPIVVDTTSKNDIVEGVPESETATYYIVEVAAGYDFDSLKNISLNAATILGARFDMLARIYKPGKGIIVPENDEDEMYRGEYYPRRPTEDENFVSIEMSYVFSDQQADTLKMVALAGMYPLKSQADSVVSILKDKISTTQTVKREVYMGCMH
jgi:hypothetical protein